MAAWTPVGAAAGKAEESESKRGESERESERIGFWWLLVYSGRENNEGHPLSKVGFSPI